MRAERCSRGAEVARVLEEAVEQQAGHGFARFETWTNPAAAVGEAVDRDQLLTNTSLYWFTRSGASAARFLSEAALSGLDWVAPSDVPAGPGWAVFNTDPVLRRDPDHKMPFHTEGGHFAAMEAPALLVEDLRTFCRAV
jgi:epoxide hydrolase